MAFNPNEHMMNLKGKDYLQVMWRLVWFREEHPDFGISSVALELTEDHAIFRTVITDASGNPVSCGHGSESKRDFGDFIEKAETKAVGRALAMLGYGTQFAADELDEGTRIVDSPVQRKKQEKPEPVHCEICGAKLTGYVDKNGKSRTIDEAAKTSKKHTGMTLCVDCLQIKMKEKTAGKAPQKKEENSPETHGIGASDDLYYQDSFHGGDMADLAIMGGMEEMIESW